MACFFCVAGDWEEEAQGEDLLSDEEGDKEPEDNLDYKASCWWWWWWFLAGVVELRLSILHFFLLRSL